MKHTLNTLFHRQTTQTLRQSYASHLLRTSPISAFSPLMLVVTRYLALRKVTCIVPKLIKTGLNQN